MTILQPSNPMKICAWNCQGLRNALTIKTLKDTILCHKPDIVFLSETKIQYPNTNWIAQHLGYDDHFNVPVNGNSSGLLLCWNKYLNLHIHIHNPNIIHTYLPTSPLAKACMISFFYGSPYHDKNISLGKTYTILPLLRAMHSLQ